MTYSADDCLNFFYSFRIDLRDTNEHWKKTLCICWYNSLWFNVRKSLKQSILTLVTLQGGCFKTIKVSIPLSYGQQRGRGFGVLEQVIRRTAIPFLPRSVIPAAKHVAADFLQNPAPKIAEVVNGRKKLKTAAKSVGRQTPRKQSSSASMKKRASRTILTKPV